MTIAPVEPCAVTRERLLALDGDYSLIYVRAVIGNLSDVPPDILGDREVVLAAYGPEGLTLLHWMARNGILHLVPESILADREAVLVQETTAGETPLHWAAKSGHLDQLPESITGSIESMLTPDKHGRTPVHRAVGEGFARMIKPGLLTHPRVISCRCLAGNSFLHEAAGERRLGDLPEEILSNHEAMFSLNNLGLSPVCLAEALQCHSDLPDSIRRAARGRSKARGCPRQSMR